MNKINFKEQILPHLIAVVLFLLITVVFYSPLFFDNKSLSQHDITQGLGGGQEAKEFRAETGEEALWTNSMFSGMPAYLINVAWDGNLIRYVESVIKLGLSSTPEVTFVAFLSFYFLLLVYGVRPYVAIAGALAFGLSSFNIISISAGHIWKMRAIAYMPLVLAGVHLLYANTSKKLYGFVILALGLTLEIKANHLQISYYLMLMLLIYGLNALIFSIKEKQVGQLVKNTSLVVAAGLIAIGCNLGSLWATYEYGQYSTRGPSELKAEEGTTTDSGLDREYVFRWSSGKLESLMLMIPNIYGGASTESLISEKDSRTLRALQRSNNPQAQQLARFASGYWGEQPGTSPIYAGAIVCFLFVLALLVVDPKIKYWMLGGTVFSLMLSWGHNFTSFNFLMFDYFPMYNKFRAVTMSLIIALMLIPLLGTLGFNKILDSKWNKQTQKDLLIALAFTAGLCLFFMAIPNVFDFKKSIEEQLPQWMVSAMVQDRISLLRADAFRSFALIVLMAAVIFFYLKGKISTQIGAALIIVLVVVDLWSVDRRYLNDDNYKRKTRNSGFSASEADKRITQDPELHNRVLNLFGTWSEANTSFYHSSIGGYHGAKMRRYQELVENCLDDQKNEVITKLQAGSGNFSDLAVLNMLNMRYIKFGEKAEQVLRNDFAFGNAWVVQQIIEANNANEEIDFTCGLKDNASCVIDKSKFNIKNNHSAFGVVQLNSYAPNNLTYESTLDNDGVVVFSEIYYPKGWKAYIDGTESPIIRANYVLRALEVPKGTHKIEFRFEPDAYFVGNKIMFASNSVLLLLLIFAIASPYLPFLNEQKK